jgi:hypothetical protein
MKCRGWVGGPQFGVKVILEVLRERLVHEEVSVRHNASGINTCANPLKSVHSEVLTESLTLLESTLTRNRGTPHT